MGATKIPYLTRTWNVTVGCEPAGEGCCNCYARASHDMRHRAYLAGKHVPPQYAEPFSRVRCLPERLDEPLHWRKPQVVGCCFMSDLFHKDVPDEFIDRVFAVMALTPHITYLLLTKRPERMRSYLAADDLQERVTSEQMVLFGFGEGNCGDNDLPSPPLPNVFLGFTAWDQPSFDAGWEHLSRTPAAHRFVSLEPQLALIDLGLSVEPQYGPTLDWVAQGAESGPGRRLPKCEACGGWSGTPQRDDYRLRPCPDCQGTGYAFYAWARAARDACAVAGTPYYLKQGVDSRGKVIAHPALDGRQHIALPWEAKPC